MIIFTKGRLIFLNITEFSYAFTKIFSANCLDKLITEESISKFFKMSSFLIKVNEKTNLTAINDEREIILKHYADSLLAYEYFSEGTSVIDIGCGAGFPSLPLAIVRPDLRITALDSTGKKIDFVKECAKELSLNNVTAVCARAEEYIAQPDIRESYDFATARAVSRLNVLSELSLGFVKCGGSFIALKAKDGAIELEEAKRGIEELGGSVVSTKPINLTDPDGEAAQRFLIHVKKITPTPQKYPRSYAKITKKPL